MQLSSTAADDRADDRPASTRAMTRASPAWRGVPARPRPTWCASSSASSQAEQRLALTDYDVLVQLAPADGSAAAHERAGRWLLLSRSGVTRLVDRLVAEGLVERVHLRRPTGAGNGRRSPTPACGGCAQRRRPTCAAWRTHFLDRLGADDLAALRAHARARVATRLAGRLPPASSRRPRIMPARGSSGASSRNRSNAARRSGSSLAAQGDEPVEERDLDRIGRVQLGVGRRGPRGRSRRRRPAGRRRMMRS